MYIKKKSLNALLNPACKPNPTEGTGGGALRCKSDRGAPTDTSN